ncbi:hypothetical protein [Streptomyces phaeochromogenes]|uniref:hypothetical protein n=1 Tax=Streptomyces phaeochromogenes TaxID=1923 RepID=UPI003720D59A
MAADWWARGIAIGAAGSAALNMLISYRTYRRVRPRVDVAIEGMGMDPAVPEDAKRQSYLFRLRLVNRSTTAITVERVAVVGVHSPFWNRTENWGKVRRFEEPLKIEPLSGLKHQENVMARGMTRLGHPPRYVRITFLLSDGSKAKSKKIKDFPGLELRRKPDA